MPEPGFSVTTGRNWRTADQITTAGVRYLSSRRIPRGQRGASSIPRWKLWLDDKRAQVFWSEGTARAKRKSRSSGTCGQAVCPPAAGTPDSRDLFRRAKRRNSCELSPLGESLHPAPCWSTDGDVDVRQCAKAGGRKGG